MAVIGRTYETFVEIAGDEYPIKVEFDIDDYGDIEIIHIGVKNWLGDYAWFPRLLPYEEMLISDIKEMLKEE